MPFDLHSRYVLLTYAQCGDLDPFEVSNALSAIEAECIIGRELHADGGTHLHAFLDFGRKRRFRNPSTFDVLGFHPNIVRSRGTPWDGYDYAIKDGDVVAGGLERPERPTASGSRRSEKWAEILLAQTREEFFGRIRELDPERLVTCFTQICKYADWEYAEAPEEYSTPDGTFDLGGYPELVAWDNQRPRGGSFSGK